MSNLNNTNSKRNMQENDDLIAEGILSLLQQDLGKAAISAADISRETGINRCVVQNHVSDGEFFPRNHQRIVDDFKQQSLVPGKQAFASAFLFHVQQHRKWFEIEFIENRYRLYKEIMDALEEQITAGWSRQTDRQKKLFYRLYCGEVFNLLSEWYEHDTFQNPDSQKDRLTRLTRAFGDGNQYRIMNVILFPEE